MKHRLIDSQLVLNVSDLKQIADDARNADEEETKKY